MSTHSRKQRAAERISNKLRRWKKKFPKPQDQSFLVGFLASVIMLLITIPTLAFFGFQRKWKFVRVKKRRRKQRRLGKLRSSTIKRRRKRKRRKKKRKKEESSSSEDSSSSDGEEEEGYQNINSFLPVYYNV